MAMRWTRRLVQPDRVHGTCVKCGDRNLNPFCVVVNNPQSSKRGYTSSKPECCGAYRCDEGKKVARNVIERKGEFTQYRVWDGEKIIAHKLAVANTEEKEGFVDRGGWRYIKLRNDVTVIGKGNIKVTLKAGTIVPTGATCYDVHQQP